MARRSCTSSEPTRPGPWNRPPRPRSRPAGAALKLVTFAAAAGPRGGAIVGDGTILALADLVPGGPDTILGLIDGGPGLWRQTADAAGAARGGLDVATARLLAPIPRPRRNVLCVGLNYAAHVAEGRAARGAVASDVPPAPRWPVIFTKNPATVNSPDGPVRFPGPLSTELDWEGELAVIIGSPGAAIEEAQAMNHVFGYTVANDVSVRDVQARPGGQFYLGKNFDGHLPLGPWIVTADELGDPNGLRIVTRVNGVVKQDGNTRDLIFNIPRIIREISLVQAFEAGDVISTGTPSGVGFARKPPEFMKPGDTVEVEIERIGVLRNPIV